MATVVVVFWSRLGSTERLALAAAVGAVQARAKIRLRWLGDTGPEPSPERERMSQEFIAPREVDLEGADGLVLLSPPHIGPDAAEWREFFDLAGRVCARKKIHAGCTQTGFHVAGFHAAMTQAGLSLIPAGDHGDPSESARLLGHRVAEACR